MRRLAFAALAIAALLVPAAATGANQSITIDATNGFIPQERVIKPSENVTFVNNAVPTDSVQFDDEATARCVTGLESNCTRNFPTAGVYKFYDPQKGCTSYDSCSASPLFRGDVVVDGPPTVTGLSGPATSTRGQTVTFTGSGSDPDNDGVASYNWDFGDGLFGSTGSGSVDHTYNSAGHFTVTLTVTDSRGNVSAPRQIGIDVAVPDSDGDGFDDDHDNCPSVPGVAPDGCPPVPLPPAIATAATAAQTLGLNGALKSGVAVVLVCSAPCTANLSLQRSPGGDQVGSTTASLPTGGSQLVTIPFDPAARASLLRAGYPKLQLVVNVTDALGRTQTLTLPITLKPVQPAGKLPAIGISDQQASTFSDPLFQILRLKYARLVTPWNSIFKDPGPLDQWLQAARGQGVQPLVAFEHRRSDLCPRKPCTAPSTGQYRRAWSAFHRKYPWVRDISPWDEVNSSTQPTGRHPELAAAYYNIVRASCRGCNVVAADVLDLNNMRKYLRAFMAKAKGKPRLWGIHNYRDTNRFRETGTRQLLSTVKGTVWFTETGGIVSFTTQGGKKALPKSESRAKRAMDFMFHLAELDAKRVKRVYVYQWKVNFKGDRFDAGVVRPDGSPRPSYSVLTLNASIARKR